MNGTGQNQKTMEKNIFAPLLAIVLFLFFGSDPSKEILSAKNVDLFKSAQNVDYSQLPDTIVSEESGITFVLINEGSFMMGAQQGEPARPDETPLHSVQHSGAFYMAAHEVTVGQFDNFVTSISEQTNQEWLTEAETGTSGMENGQPGGLAMNTSGVNEFQAGASWRNPGYPQTNNHPVVYMSWNDAKAYANWLMQEEDLGYRLPTEAEWEYACRANTNTAYWWGDGHDNSGEVANVRDLAYFEYNENLPDIMQANDGFVHTSPVGTYNPNAFNLYDMIGNVWEWVEDYYGPYGSGPEVDPTGPATGNAKVARGGGFANAPDRLRSAARFQDLSQCRFSGMGFRLALEIDARLIEKYGQ